MAWQVCWEGFPYLPWAVLSGCTCIVFEYGILVFCFSSLSLYLTCSSRLNLITVFRSSARDKTELLELTHHDHFPVLDTSLSVLCILIHLILTDVLILLIRKQRWRNLLASNILSCGASLVPESVFLSQYHLSLITTTIYYNLLSAFSVPGIGLGVLLRISHLMLTDNVGR